MYSIVTKHSSYCVHTSTLVFILSFFTILLSCSDAPTYALSICDSEPALVEKVDPVYHRLARQAGIEGDVILTYIVDINGQVRNVTVVQSDIKMLEDAAVRAVSQYKYSPAICYGRPVESEVTTTIKFRLT